MKVRCVRLIDPFTRKPREHDHWLAVGEVYKVLSIEPSSGKYFYRLFTPREPTTPGLHDIAQFEIISSVIPPNWVIVQAEKSDFEITPERWTRAGFLEDYFNCVPDAIRIFNEEVAVIEQCEP